MNKNYYQKIGGFAPMPFMEDLDLILKVPKKNKVLLRSYVETSFRNYQKNGIFKQCIKNIMNQIKFLLK